MSVSEAVTAVVAFAGSIVDKMDTTDKTVFEQMVSKLNLAPPPGDGPEDTPFRQYPTVNYPRLPSPPPPDNWPSSDYCPPDFDPGQATFLSPLLAPILPTYDTIVGLSSLPTETYYRRHPYFRRHQGTRNATVTRYKIPMLFQKSGTLVQYVQGVIPRSLFSTSSMSFLDIHVSNHYRYDPWWPRFQRKTGNWATTGLPTRRRMFL
ncbi:hypothetical protein SPBR_09158 [Sporothrix brasiliensis 5110]|uniref:Uncharacterized protein n=1 Tax=Sporothrix brasiliensis 5110 TaxID=1398154 RepID=A0A0C2IVZ9_9PEZI|nr:uncharacterized protein SPBR_09158 [Sporothrix brasiliensis 5110]KIH93331.1 hypothetical protein SPBR_09158 [Sporothrix brasiliensis 5110]